MTRNYSQVGFLGDTHGNLRWVELRLKDLHDAGITLVFQVGDWGGYWPSNDSPKFRYRVNKLLAQYGMKLLVTLGNHEDYAQIEKNLKEVKSGTWKGFLWDERTPQIRYFKRGQVWEFSGVRFQSLGGAASIDRAYRTPNRSWWEGEKITLEDIYNTNENARNTEGEIDVFIAHDIFASANIWPNGGEGAGGWSLTDLAYAQTSRDALQMVVEVVKPKLWFFGHYHFRVEGESELVDVTGAKFTTKFACLNRDNDTDSLIILDLATLEYKYVDYTFNKVRGVYGA